MFGIWASEQSLKQIINWKQSNSDSKNTDPILMSLIKDIPVLLSFSFILLCKTLLGSRRKLNTKLKKKDKIKENKRQTSPEGRDCIRGGVNLQSWGRLFLLSCWTLFHTGSHGLPALLEYRIRHQSQLENNIKTYWIG